MEMIAPITGSLHLGFGDNIPEPPNKKSFSESAKLEAACKDFVSLIYAYMFQQMRESGMNDEENSLFGGENTSMFIDFLDQEIGKKFSREDGADLPKILYRQLTREDIEGKFVKEDK